MASSPTQRSLNECRKRGWEVQVVERWNQYARRRIDLFGVIDIVAITPDGILAIQACSGTDHARRRDKVLEEPRAAKWIAAGAKLAIWSWTKKGKADARKLWALREDIVQLDDFAQEAA